MSKVIRASSYPHAEIHLTDWGSSLSSRDATHDSFVAGTYITKANSDCIGLANSLSYWTFIDMLEEKGAGDTIWHGLLYDQLSGYCETFVSCLQNVARTGQ